MTTIALAIPHTPWISERAKSMARLRAQLANGSPFEVVGPSAKPKRDSRARTFVPHPDEVKNVREGFAELDRGEGIALTPQEVDRWAETDHYREFTDKAPNQVWSVEMWRWMLETGAEFCLTVQDDALAAPCFWPALRAMLTQLPRGHLLGLSGVHPMAAEVARRGHRWYRTTSWIIGWAYGLWREDLEDFLDWRTSDEGEAFTAAIAPNGEDAVLNHWTGTIAKRDVWHPVPTVVDHDVSIDSSYDNDDHGHRRPWVTWHRYAEADLVRPEFWLVNGREPVHYHTVPQHLCWWCMRNKPVRGSQVTGAAICALCLVQTLGDCMRHYSGQ